MSFKDDKKKRQQLIIGIIITIYVIIFVFVFLAFLDVIVIDDLITNIILYVAIGLALVGLGIWGIIYIRAKQKKKVAKEQKVAERIQNQRTTQVQRQPSQVRNRTVSNSSKEVNVDSLIYTGSTDGQICGICKLSFQEKQTVCTCPYCESLFHKNHLEEWLVDYNDCPVCNRDLTGYITKN